MCLRTYNRTSVHWTSWHGNVSKSLWKACALLFGNTNTFQKKHSEQEKKRRSKHIIFKLLLTEAACATLKKNSNAMKLNFRSHINFIVFSLRVFILYFFFFASSFVTMNSCVHAIICFKMNYKDIARARLPSHALACAHTTHIAHAYRK